MAPLPGGNELWVTDGTSADVSIDHVGGDDYLAMMTDVDVARFRTQADECFSQGDRALRAADRDAWLRMAKEWTTLAEDAERRVTGR